MSELTRTTSDSSDAELISAVRSGDNDAYAELFSRHHDSAMRMARQLAAGPDADDLVAEGFLRVMSVIQAGKGPDEFFRAYLLSTIRRLHIDRIRASQRVRTTDDEAELDRVVRFVDPVEMTFEQNAAAEAFASLPERWQLVLWHLDVEGQKPAQIAPLLGLSANSVSALAYRAREGLRLAYLQGHLAPPIDDTCRWTTSHLGQYVRKALSKRETARIDAHLDTCHRCAALCLELTEVNSNLPGLLAPVVLGTAATGYLSSGGAAAAMGTLGQIGDWLTKPFRATGLTGPVAGTVVAAVAVAAVSAVAVAQIVSNDEPEASAPVIAPTRSTGTAPSTPVPEPESPSKPAPTKPTTTAPPLVPHIISTVPTPPGTPTTPKTPPATPPTTPPTTPSTPPPTTPPGPTSTDYGVTVGFADEAPEYQRRVTIGVTAAGDAPSGSTLTLTMSFDASGDTDVTFRGGLGADWSCGSLVDEQVITTMTCTRPQTGLTVPALTFSLQGYNPHVTVSVSATDNVDETSSNDSAVQTAPDWQAP